jgi:protein-S-isoprenylcysteine O-methyltransferase Ste14
MSEDLSKVCLTRAYAESKMIHHILSWSYLMYLGVVVFGIILNIIYPIAFSNTAFSYMGAVFMILGTSLIYWAQESSKGSSKEMEKTNEPRNFECGPYKYTRNPTHIGISLSVLGFGFLIGSLYVVTLLIIAYTISKLVFLPREEALLEKKYGKPYCDYREKVSSRI